MKEIGEVDLTIRNGEVVIGPAERAPSLDSLIEPITDENRHDEIRTGRPLGNENW